MSLDASSSYAINHCPLHRSSLILYQSVCHSELLCALSYLIHFLLLCLRGSYEANPNSLSIKWNPLMVNPDVMSEKNLLKVAFAYPELPIKGEHNGPFTL